MRRTEWLGRHGATAARILGVAAVYYSGAKLGLLQELLSAVVTERRNTHEEIRRVCAQLAEALSRLDPGAAAEQWPPPRRQKPDGGG
ncbi:hypothetical protein ACWGJW_29290 [Streptomyces nigrescens]